MRILHLLSHLTGKLANIYLPFFVRKPLYVLFASLYNVNIGEVEYDLVFYNSFAEFFTRNLKYGTRPIASGFVSPADSLFIDAGKIDENKMIGVKGCSYLIPELLSDENISKKFTSGSFYNYYLAPGDYHHVHSPVSGEIISRIYTPGSLYPVSKSFVKIFPDLYTRQERVSLIIKDKQDNYFAVIMVGAFNVGSIGLNSEPEFRTNLWDSPISGNVIHYHDGREVTAGDRVGTFHLGSTVVILSSIEYRQNALKINLGSKVKYGQMVQEE